MPWIYVVKAKQYEKAGVVHSKEINAFCTDRDKHIQANVALAEAIDRELIPSSQGYEVLVPREAVDGCVVYEIMTYNGKRWIHVCFAVQDLAGNFHTCKADELNAELNKWAAPKLPEP